MKYNEINIFDGQPEITEDTLKELEKARLIVSEKTSHFGLKRVAEVRNKKIGHVVGYNLLCDAIKSGEMTQERARALVVIELAKTNGKPRQQVLDRLLTHAFVGDKAQVKERIEKLKG